MADDFPAFRARREAGNARVLDTDNLAIKRFFGLDKQVYGEGALDVRTKELLGLVASMVLRCNDCIDYHLDRCVQEGLGKAELDEAFAVALMVGGSIVIPHARHAAESVAYLLEEREAQG
jgi:AhpD family alkylhydroperoxidase